MKRRYKLLTFAAILAVIVGAFRGYAGRRKRQSVDEDLRWIKSTEHSAQKPTLVIVHGLGGSAYHVNHVLHPHFVGYANVITISLPGHGGQEAIPESERTIPKMAKWLRARIAEELDAIGVEQCTLLGISLGGELSRRLVIDEARSDRIVKELILFDAPYRSAFAPRWHRALFGTLFKLNYAARPFLGQDGQALLIKLIGRTARSIGNIEEDIDRWYESTEVYEINAHCERINDQQLHWPSWVWSVRAILTYDGEEVVKQFPQNVPLLLIGGKETTDPIVQTGAALSEAIPHSEVVWVDGAHTFPYHHPKAFATIVIDWMQEQELRRLRESK